MPLDAVRHKARRIGEILAKAPRQIWKLTTDPKLTAPYWPDEARKSRPRIFLDLVWWFVRFGEVNAYYYVYGLDRRGRTRPDVLPYGSFRRIRNRANLRTGSAPYNYVCVLRDKFLFAQFVSSLGLATPRCFALLNRDGITWLDENRTSPLESLTQRPRVIDGFCKQVGGIQGDGAFPLVIKNGQLLVKGNAISMDELRARLDDDYLLQERIQQHPQISALNPSSINTIRLITFCRSGEVTLFSAAMRIGTLGKSVDNWAAGGLIVSVDPTRGSLRGQGFFKPGYGGRTDKHPNSGIVFEGFQIPFFDEAVRLVSQLHRHLRGVHSIGWDVAITPSGPTIIEGNDDWEGGIPMVLERDFRERFLRMFSQNRAPQRKAQAGSEVDSAPTNPAAGAAL
jgi:putative polysaccharide biosynthesis protein